MPSTCSKKGQKQFCCPKNAAETPKDEVKYYMNRYVGNYKVLDVKHMYTYDHLQFFQYFLYFFQVLPF